VNAKAKPRTAAASKPARPVPRRAPDPDADVADRLLKHWHEDVPDDRLAHLVKDTSRAFLRALQLRLAAHGVALGHWTFLRILWQRDGMTQRELSLEAGVMEPTTLHALRAMEAAGWVVRAQRPGNRRNLAVMLTPAGRRLKSKLVPLAEEVNAVAVAGLSARALAVTRGSLLAMLDSLARDTAARDAGTAPAPRSAKRR
jgi:DNA-binding MarR family transcriptional regulator